MPFQTFQSGLPHSHAFVQGIPGTCKCWSYFCFEGVNDIDNIDGILAMSLNVVAMSGLL